MQQTKQSAEVEVDQLQTQPEENQDLSVPIPPSQTERKNEESEGGSISESEESYRSKIKWEVVPQSPNWQKYLVYFVVFVFILTILAGSFLGGLRKTQQLDRRQQTEAPTFN